MLSNGWASSDLNANFMFDEFEVREAIYIHFRGHYEQNSDKRYVPLVLSCHQTAFVCAFVLKFGDLYSDFLYKFMSKDY